MRRTRHFRSVTTAARFLTAIPTGTVLLVVFAMGPVSLSHLKARQRAGILNGERTLSCLQVS